MIKCESVLNTTPLYSVIVAIYNDWVVLDRCLQSLMEQVKPPSFEVVVVDDGSKTPSPEFVHRWEKAYPLTVVRQPHRGIAAARNRGIQVSLGSILVFVDADCKLQSDCLAVLAETINQSPQHNCFQLRLTGDCSGLVGRAEELRLLTLQQHRLEPNGCIRYLNTAGCAMRRESVQAGGSVFEPSALRSEDTLFSGEPDGGGGTSAVCSPCRGSAPAIPLSLPTCFLKDVRSAYLNISASRRSDCRQGSQTSSQPSGAHRYDGVDVEDFQTAIDWAHGLVRRHYPANSFAMLFRDLRFLSDPAELGHVLASSS